MELIQNQDFESDLFQKLKQFDTPTVCNAIELFNLRPRCDGYMDQRIKACFPGMEPIVGYAATATYRASNFSEGDVYSTIDSQVATFNELPGPPIVVFQDLDCPSVAASFGEVMCSIYKSFDVVGLITSGAVRDLSQVRDLNFPMFSNGAICSHGYGHIEDLMVEVCVGGLNIHAGDLLHADENGVVSIPKEIIGELEGVCSEYCKAESIVIDYTKNTNEVKNNTEDRLSNDLEFDSKLKGLIEARRACAEDLNSLSKRISKRNGKFF